MLIAGIILVILTFVLIVKKYEARLILFCAGLIMCLIGGLPEDNPLQGGTRQFVPDWQRFLEGGGRLSAEPPA